MGKPFGRLGLPRCWFIQICNIGHWLFSILWIHYFKGASLWNMPLKKTPTLTTDQTMIHFLARHRPRLGLGTTHTNKKPARSNVASDVLELISTNSHGFLTQMPRRVMSCVHALLMRLWNANVYRCLCRSLYADHSLAPFWCETMGMMNLILMTKSPKCISCVCLYSSFTLPPNLSHLLKCFGRLIFFWLPGATCWREFCANPELYESLSLKEYLPWN